MSLIGRDTTTNKDIEIEQGHRTRGCYIIGATGSGKSVLTEQLAVQDAKEGLGFCVIDPHGQREDSLINNILVRIPPNREKDVILLDPLDTGWPFGLNLFSCDDIHDPIAVSRTLNNISHVFSKIFGMSLETPRLRYFVRNLSLPFIGTEYTMCEVPHMLLDKPFRDRIVQKFAPDNLFWKSYQSLGSAIQQVNAESTLDRVDGLTTDPIIRYIVGQSKSKLNFSEIMETNKIVLVPLAAELADMTNLIGAILVGQILQAALGRKNVKKQFNLYLDEFHQYATADMPTLLVQARGFGIGTAICHQSRYQEGITDSIRSTTLQASSLVIFRVTSEDAEVLAPNFDTTPIDAGEREKTIPSDVLMHLSDHPQKFIKDFERQFTRKFLQAKALHTREESYEGHPNIPGGGIYEVTHYDIVYPEFPFDDEPIKFDPNDLLAFLEALETMLFDIMHHQGKTGDEFNDVMKKWGVCCSGLLYPTKQGVRNNVDKTSNINTRMIEEREKRCGARYIRFRDALLRVMSILKDEPVLVYPSTRPDENISRQTHADRQAEIANELTHLPIGAAKVRVPKWDKDAREVVMVEHTIRTILPYTPKADLARLPQIRQKYLEQTRKLYCRPRAEVEEEIRKRTLPPPSTTRRDSI